MQSDDRLSETPPPWQTDPAGFGPSGGHAPPPPRGPHPFFAELDAATPHSVFVPVLIAINVIVYVAMVVRGVNWWMPTADETIRWGVDFWPLTTTGDWWRLLTSAFVHFGIFHIALNMWALYAVGKFTERLYGNLSFLLIYLFSAVLSGLSSIWWNHEAAAAGASGAIFAIYGALMAYLLFQRAAFPHGAVQRLLRSTTGFVILNIVFGFSVKGISNAAHLGGLAAGFVLGAVMARPLNPARRKALTIPKLLAGVAFATALTVAGVALIPRAMPAQRAEVDFPLALDELAPDQARAEAQGDDLFAKLEAGRIKETEFADRLDREVIPTWAHIVNRLKAIPVAENSPQRSAYVAAVRGSEIVQQTYAQLSATLRSTDPADRKKADAILRMLHQQATTKPSSTPETTEPSD